jgi:hypothetical protein
MANIALRLRHNYLCNRNRAYSSVGSDFTKSFAFYCKIESPRNRTKLKVLTVSGLEHPRLQRG